MCLGRTTAVCGSGERKASNAVGTSKTAVFSSLYCIIPDPVRPRCYYVSDERTIRHWDEMSDTVTLVAGDANREGRMDGVGISAGFYSILYIAIDSAGRTIWASDHSNHSIRCVDTLSQHVTTFPVSSISGGIKFPQQLVWDRTPGVKPDSALFVTASAKLIRIEIEASPSHLIFLVWRLVTCGVCFACVCVNRNVCSDPRFYIESFQSGVSKGSVTGLVHAFCHALIFCGCEFCILGGAVRGVKNLYGLACAANGVLFFSCGSTTTVWSFDPASKQITLIAGKVWKRGREDGLALDARFTDVNGLLLDDDAQCLFVVDRQWAVIRKITLPSEFFPLKQT